MVVGSGLLSPCPSTLGPRPLGGGFALDPVSDRIGLPSFRLPPGTEK